MNLLRRLITTVALFAGLAGTASALLVPYIEDFATGPANWRNGTNGAPLWAPWGGVGDGAYIAAPGTIDTNGFGPIVFRGNNANDASGDAFVGNWLAGGVNLFTVVVRHDAPVPLGFFVRFDAGAGNAASSNPFLVAPNQWTLLSIPIINSLGPGEVFQSYGAAGTNFGLIFGSIQNVQIALSANQAPQTTGQTYIIGMDRPRIIPEPGTSALLLLGGFAVLGGALWRRRQS